MIGYTLSHIILGQMSNYATIISPMFVTYQIFQLAINTRFFIQTFKWKHGNNVLDTSRKLGEFMIGKYFINI